MAEVETRIRGRKKMADSIFILFTVSSMSSTSEPSELDSTQSQLSNYLYKILMIMLHLGFSFVYKKYYR